MLKNAAWVAFLVACSKGAATDKDWSRIGIDDTIQGSVNNVSFELKLPKGWKRDVDEAHMKGWRPNVEDYTNAPSVTVGFVHQPPNSLDAYIKNLTFAGEPIIDKKIMNADFLVVVAHTADNGVVKVDYMSHKGETYLGCSAFQMRSGGVPNPKATAEWLESICRTLTIK